ncbi:MAG: polysaccharide pyruvyl transferase family protein, partial [Polyangiaceae bacterium]
PFEDPRVRTAFVAAVSAARRFFVRDEASLEHAERSGADMSKVTSAPDVTFDCVVPPPQDAVPDLILVPNERLVTPETGSVEVVTYVDLMIQLGQIGRQLGRKARVVVHGGSGGDLDLASRIASALECRVELLGPIAFKSSVGDRSVVVASRFHALLSSLAQGASAMALGWSHKYPMLMDQFGLSEFNTTPSKALSTPERLMGDLDDHARSGAQRIVAQEQVREARARLTDVWAELASFSSDVNNP